MRVHLHGAQHGNIDMPSTDQAKALRGIKETGAGLDSGILASSIQQVRIGVSNCTARSNTQKAVLRFKRHFHVLRKKIGHLDRKPDSQVHHVAGLQFLGNTACNSLLHIQHGSSPSTMDSTRMPGVITWLGSNSPTSTTFSAPTITWSAAKAIAGLKFRVDML